MEIFLLVYVLPFFISIIIMTKHVAANGYLELGGFKNTPILWAHVFKTALISAIPLINIILPAVGLIMWGTYLYGALDAYLSYGRNPESVLAKPVFKSREKK